MKQILPPDALALAPMATLTHRGMREMAAAFGGCDLYYTEMANARSVLASSRWEEFYADPLPHPDKTIIQIVGSEAADIAQAVAVMDRRLEEAGTIPFGYDINMGCSAPEIIRCGGGAVWLRKPVEAAALVALVRPSIPDRSLSVKLRIGETDDTDALLSLGRAFQDAGADFLTLHPRLRPEKYSRPPRWNRVYGLAEELRIPVLGNGDIDSWATWEKRRTDAAAQGKPLAGAMLGRSAVRMPWIFALLRGIQRDPNFSMEIDLAEVASGFVELLKRYQPPEFLKSRARRFFFHFSENLDYGNRIKSRTQEGDTPEECLAIFMDYFRDAPGERVKRYSAE